MCSKPASVTLVRSKRQPLEFGQPFEALQPCIGHLGFRQIHADHRLDWTLRVTPDFAVESLDLGNRLRFFGIRFCFLPEARFSTPAAGDVRITARRTSFPIGRLVLAGRFRCNIKQCSRRNTS